MIHEFQQKALDKAAERKARKPDYDRRNAPSHTKGKDSLAAIKTRAAERGWDFDLTTDWLNEKLARTHCEATGLPFSGSRRDPFGRTIDRLDNSKGYTQENCWVVCWIYNRCKLTGTHAEVMKMAEALVAKSQ